MKILLELAKLFNQTEDGRALTSVNQDGMFNTGMGVKQPHLYQLSKDEKILPR